MLKVEDFFLKSSDAVVSYLCTVFSKNKPYKELIESELYSLMSGGKRFRPALVFATSMLFDHEYENLVPVAAGIECLHTYSLIHDDLPSMDNDDIRRGKPTNHKVYGECVAILAGDGLQTKGFEIILGNEKFSKEINLDIALTLSKAIGNDGMVGGQFLDTLTKSAIDYSEDNEKLLLNIHKLKTGALIEASCKVAGIAIGLDNQKLEDISKIGSNIGLLFQMVDDILDIVSTEKVLGKTVGKDVRSKKLTFPSLYGLEKTIKMADELLNSTADLVRKFNVKDSILENIVFYARNRIN